MKRRSTRASVDCDAPFVARPEGESCSVRVFSDNVDGDWIGFRLPFSDPRVMPTEPIGKRKYDALTDETIKGISTRMHQIIAPSDSRR